MSTDPMPKPNPSPATAPLTISPSATSKKRTHEEISPEDESMGGTLPPSKTPVVSPTAIEDERMAHINPLTGTTTTAETRTGTWFEDQLEMKLQQDVEDTDVQTRDAEGRSPKRKIQRLDTSSDADIDVAANPTESPKVTVADPTHLLGIGWTQVGEDSGFIAMARGYSRYISNHYPLTVSEILLKSKSLDAYLVRTDQGYFLFPEDLSEARLVARTWEDTVANLQSAPVRYSSAQALRAARTPGTSRESDNGTGSSAVEVEGGDMEMD